MKKLFFLIAIGIFSCSKKSKEKELFPENKFSIEHIGKTKESSYTFCSITTKEIKYSYRIGLWSFYTKDKKRIAEGKYETKSTIIDSIGGCSYSYIENSIDLKKWKFWNEDGKEIKPTKRLISIINYNNSSIKN